MDYFQDNGEQVQLQVGEVAFKCPTSEFLVYEPLYTTLEAGFVIRKWSTEKQYLSTGNSQQPDPLYTASLFTQFLSKIATYQDLYDNANQVILDGTVLTGTEHGVNGPYLLTEADLTAMGDLQHESGESYWKVWESGDTIDFTSEKGDQYSRRDILQTIKDWKKLQILTAQKAFIESRYDKENRDGFTGVYNHPDTAAEVKTAIQGLFDWLMNPVTNYMYTQHDLVDACTSIAEVEAIVWDFDQFIASDPLLDLRDYITP